MIVGMQAFVLIASLHFSGAVPMTDIRAYAEWLAK